MPIGGDLQVIFLRIHRVSLIDFLEENLQLPHVPYTNTVTGKVIPTKKLIKSREREQGKKDATQTLLPKSPKLFEKTYPARLATQVEKPSNPQLDATALSSKFSSVLLPKSPSLPRNILPKRQSRTKVTKPQLKIETSELAKSCARFENFTRQLFTN
jgi:hypothetical protein